MSKGIGQNYLESQRGFIQWHKNDLENRMYVNIPDGKKAGMPRYFKDKLYSDQEREKIKKTATVRAADKILSAPGFVHIDKRAIRKQELAVITTPYKDKL
jgi:hypothetical protein